MKRDPVREALQALAEAARRPADIALVLRLFALRGDAEPGVLADGFGGLLAIDPAGGPTFVGDRLAAADADMARAAALALGEPRLPDTVAARRARLRAEDRPDVRHAIIRGLATTRRDEAFDTLIELIGVGTDADSKAAIQALTLFPQDEERERRVQAALTHRRPAPNRRSTVKPRSTNVTVRRTP